VLLPLGMKILVVHRQKSNVDLIKSVLSSSNPVVLYTESGLDGLLTSRIEYFDVIVCGTDLPVLTGFELIRSIRNNSINRQTPVIMVPNVIDDNTIHLATALGVAAVLSPFEFRVKLADVVADCVQPLPDRVWQSLAPLERLN
jgi:CheY-like chemotaxis protein